MHGYERLTAVGVLTLVCAAATACGTTSTSPGGDPCGDVVAPELVVLGEIETAVVHPSGLALEARVDTGATTSSVDAIDIREFQQDDRPWVRFRIPAGDDRDPIDVRTELVRVILVKRHGGDPIRRPVVRLDVSVGAIRRTSDFSLTDRSGFEFPVLLGRTYLEGVATVDVSRRHAASVARPATPPSGDGGAE